MADQELATMADSGWLRPRGIARTFVLIAFGLVVLGLWVYVSLSRPHSQMVLKTWMKNAGHVREGASVRLAGVDVGYVKTVRARPEDREFPGYIEMALTAPYSLKVPRDS